MDYAIVRTGGKQYKVSPGQAFDVERLPQAVGATVELTEVLALDREGQVTIGTPLVEGARVVAVVQDHGREDKVIAFKYNPKARNRVKRGHRQPYTRLLVKEFAVGEAAEAEPAVAETVEAKAEEAASEPAEAEPQAQAAEGESTEAKSDGA